MTCKNRDMKNGYRKNRTGSTGTARIGTGSMVRGRMGSDHWKTRDMMNGTGREQWGQEERGL